MSQQTRAAISTPTTNNQLIAQWKTNSSKLLFSALIDWSIIITAWFVINESSSNLVTVLAIVVIAGRIHALGAILHDACHANIRRKTIRWYLVEALAGWPVSSTIEAMSYHHLRHHRYVGTQKDPYLPVLYNGKMLPKPLLYARGLLLPTWWTIRPVVGLFALIAPKLQSSYAFLFLQDRSRQNLYKNNEVIKCAKADLVQLSAHIALLIIIVIWQLPFLTTYLIPLHIAGVLNARRVALEHPQITDGKLYEIPISPKQQADLTVSSGTGLLEKWFLSPHNMGLHIEHHRYPRVAYQHLPKVKLLETNS